jgi:hypothetical protein
MQVCVQGVGVLGPGFPDWKTTREILCGERTYLYEPASQPNPDILPATERRRGAKSMRWAVAAAQQAVAGSGIAAADLGTVFTSSGGDGETLHHICEALTEASPEVSPTRFHNSVHNAAAGYWSIAAGSRRPSTSLCGYDFSFAVGLIEAASQVSIEQAPVLLVAYDLPYPQPLFAMRPIAEPFAVALLFTPEPRPGTLAYWRIGIEAGRASISLPKDLPEALWRNPAAHALPLLSVLARGESRPLSIEYLNDSRVIIASLKTRSE